MSLVGPRPERPELAAAQEKAATQLAAAESAIHNVSALMLQDHLETCVVEQIQRGNTEIVDEAMQLIKRFAR